LIEIQPPPQPTTVQQAIDRIWETIPPTWHRVREQLRGTAVEQFGITVEQFHVLRHVRKGAATVSELAEVKQISASAISQAVDLLVEKDLLARAQDRNDRRRVHLTLTEHGAELLASIFQQNRAWMMEKLAALSADELAMLERGLALLKASLVDG
jgi:DNA-binding MarR family transcriptional regulator